MCVWGHENKIDEIKKKLKPLLNIGKYLAIEKDLNELEKAIKIITDTATDHFNENKKIKNMTFAEKFKFLFGGK